jgi:hypothetical protein
MNTDIFLDTSLSSSLSLLSTTIDINLPVSLSLTRDQAEQLAGPFFGLSLFPYLAFLYFLNVDENNTPKGVVVGFATCLLFVFLTIPAAIAAQLLYGVSLADSDWLHGSAESLLTITNLVTVVAFRQALRGKEFEKESEESEFEQPKSVTSYQPMITLVVILTALAGITALVPALNGPQVHTPYLGGFMDLPHDLVNNFLVFFGIDGRSEPLNALTVGWYVQLRNYIQI